MFVYAFEKVKDQNVGRHKVLKWFTRSHPGGDQWHTYSHSYTPDESVEVICSFHF